MFWDTPALLKLYVNELDSDAFRLIAAAPGEAPTISAITLVEAFSAFRRKERAGDLGPGWAERLTRDLDADCQSGRIEVVRVSEETIRAARQAIRGAAKTSVVLRSLDAIQVASAMASGSDAIVSTDARLREVARGVGVEGGSGLVVAFTNAITYASRVWPAWNRR